VAQLSIDFYLFGCLGCGRVTSQTAKDPPICRDADCPRYGESLISWLEIMERIDGEGWKYG